MKLSVLVIAVGALISGIASAQTAVTTTGGTSNAVPKFSGAATLVNSAITESSGNVGIGTAAPGSSLDVRGNIGTNSAFGFSNIQQVTSPFSVYISAPTSNTLGFFTNSTQRMTINGSGRVGIDTTTPGYQLDVQGGQINSSAGYCINGSNCITAWPSSGSNTAIANTWAAAQTFTSSTNFPLGIWSSSGSVGIGTTIPMEMLHVVDSVGMGAGVAGSGAFGNGNAIIQSSYGGRAVGTGSALSFAFPANTDGSNVWEQARIVGTPDNNLNSSAAGRLYLQTRHSVPGAWNWNNNLVLTSDGGSTFGGNITLTAGTGASVTYQDGTVQTTAWNGILAGGDYAESVDVLGDRSAYEPGDVIVIDDAETGKFNKSAEPYSKFVAGVYSTKPGLVGRRATVNRPDKEDEVPMAMMGIVPTKVSTENGPIQRGDLLVSSSKPGFAMRGTDREKLSGAVIGKALAPLKSGFGVVEVLISLQ